MVGIKSPNGVKEEVPFGKVENNSSTIRPTKRVNLHTPMPFYERERFILIVLKCRKPLNQQLDGV